MSSWSSAPVHGRSSWLMVDGGGIARSVTVFRAGSSPRGRSGDGGGRGRSEAEAARLTASIGGGLVLGFDAWL